MLSLRVILAAVSLATAAFGAAPAVDGVWRSQGWGFVYQIRQSDWQAFEVTNSTCVATSAAKRVPYNVKHVEAAFQERKGHLFFVWPGSDNDHKRITTPSGLSSIVIERIAELPTVCTPPTANTPLNSFEVFARTFAEQYISFDLRHVDWERSVLEQRKKITARTTPTELFKVLSAMIAPLTDIHTGIEAPKLKREFDPEMRPGTDRVMQGNIERFAKGGRKQLASITNRRYLNGRVVGFCRGQWQYGLVADGVGYLRILQFGDYARGGPDRDIRALNGALDKILGNRALRALIIDVRLSFGGDDRLGLAIAGRLTAKEYMAYSIQARSDPTVPNRYTPAQGVMVRPGKQPLYVGPIVELIGPVTMSAAETFTQALMERTPRVLRVGENTQGVFCDPLERHLPNGWRFDLPNAVYRTSDGRAFDVIGIPPDIAAPVFREEDVAAQRDPAMDIAIQSLTKKAYNN